LSPGDELQSRRALLARPLGLLDVPAPVGHGTLDATISRRTLLLVGGAGAALLGVPGLVRLKRLAFPGGVPAYLKRETYEPLVGSSFTVPGTGHSLKLLSVEGLKHSPGGFSLIFRARKGASPFGPVIDGLRHPRLGAIGLVLLPVERPVHGQSYQAIVDRHVTRKEVGSHSR
jgi:hypothetical protein